MLIVVFFLMIRRPPRSTQSRSSAASDVYKRQDEIGLHGVPLYPGTKHTTATETAKLLGTEKALKASGLTNRAFERYCQVENNDTFEVVKEVRKTKKAKVIKMNVKQRIAE